MKRIDNAEMLALFDKDINRNFYHCHDITMAGRDGYKIKEICYFVQEGVPPLSSFLCVKTYYDDSLVVGVNSRDEGFWEEAAEYLQTLTAAEVDITSPYKDFFEFPGITEKFSFVSSEDGAAIYALTSPDALPPLMLSDGVTVALATEEDRQAVQADLSLLDALEEDLRTVDLFDACDCFFDTRFYLLKEGNKVIGFLRGECGYKNYYDVGWVYVAPAYQGRGYGKLLTLSFSHDLLKNGLYPHYGFAINPESEAVAKKCGFTCTRPSAEFKRIERK